MNWMGKASRLAVVAINDPREALDRLGIAASGALDRTGRAQLARGRDEWERIPGDWSLLGDALGVDARLPPPELDAAWQSFWSGVDFRSGHDADPALVRTVWTAVILRRPGLVVETGVGRGLSTAAILDALDRVGEGRLVSLDLPPLSEPWFSESCSLVPAASHSRWEYIRVGVRRGLPRLLARLRDRFEHIDLYVADSLHTRRHVLWELTTARTGLGPTGLMILDDLEAFPDDCRDRGARLFRHEFKSGCFGVITNP